MSANGSRDQLSVGGDRELVAATANPNKLTEIEAIMDGGWRILPAAGRSR